MLGNLRLISAVIANPEPQISIGPLNCESTIAQRDPGRPDLVTVTLAYFLEL